MPATFSRRIGCTILLSIISTANLARESLWIDVDTTAIAARGERWVEPQQARTVALDVVAVQQFLGDAPIEGALTPRNSPTVLSLPMPDGTFARFGMVHSSVMEPGLAAKFPELRTFLGQGLDDPTASARIDIGPKGFHAQVIGAAGEVYIDPYQVNDNRHHVVYSRVGVGTSPKSYRCGTHDPDHRDTLHEAMSVIGRAPANPAGTSLRTYRLAIASTASYTNAFGGTVADGIAGLVTMVNRLNGVYEREFALRLVLVANNDLIVYTSSNVGPIGNSPNGPDQVIQTTIDNAIGFANYDLGHAVGGSGGGGAITPLGNVCGLSKSRGFTSLNPPRGDIFDIDFVAHELGHQLGGSHTWNGCGGGSQWTATSAMEPGSGTTIMAYAGICPDNLLPNSDAYFHARSFTQIWNILNNGGPGNNNKVCGTVAATGNSVPSLTAPANITIPERTPFKLTASGNDADVGDVVTYNWEQVDTGAQGSPSTTGDNGTAPLFRSFPASTSPTRMFPSLVYILDNANMPPNTIPLPPAGGSFRTAEILPNPPNDGSRVMNFRVTARDGRAGGGGLRHSDNVQATAIANAGPFLIGNVTGTQTAGGSLGVTWAVANTNVAPINTSQVNLLISYDGGVTFRTLLANTDNDGSENVTLPPGIDTTRARIQVAAANGNNITTDNTYFDITDANFEIDAGAAAVTVTVSGSPTDLIATQQGSPAGPPRNIAAISGGVAPFTAAAFTYPANPDISIQNVQVTDRTVSATAAASCLIAAPNLPSFRIYPAVLRVIDVDGREASAVFPINVSNNSIPTLGTYANTMIPPGASTNVTPSAGPADANANLTTVTVVPGLLPGGGTVSVGNDGVVSISTTTNTALGAHVITVSVRDGCDAVTSKSFTLNVVDPNPYPAFDLASVTSGNLVLDPLECNSVNVAIDNLGGSTATAVHGVLATSTPGVTIVQPTSAYPAIPVGETRTNGTDYEVGTDGSLACGSLVSFTHTVTFAESGLPRVLNFTLPIGVPAGPNYTFANQAGTTAPTGATLVPDSQNDDGIVDVPLPGGFDFEFYGVPVTQLRADTNGVLVFHDGPASSVATNVPLPSSPHGGSALFAHWDDLDTRSLTVTGGGIYTTTSGSAPNRIVDIEWRAVRWQSGVVTPSAPSVVFSVRLHEGSDQIEMFYGTVVGNGGATNGNSATVGVQSARTGTILTQFSHNTASLSAGLKLTPTRAPAVCTPGPAACGPLADNLLTDGFE